jgi:amidohydrolase
MRRLACAALIAWLTVPVPAAADLELQVRAIEPRLIEWRRDIHANPELGNREFRTAKLVAEHLESLGMTVRAGIAHTGVVGILEGGRPGPLVALRADMDALPITEKTGLPFASQVQATYNGQPTGVMHACGHDAHTAMLMAAAEVLASMRDGIGGSVMFIFQPAEEGAPDGEEGGARLMLEEGLFDETPPAAVFGLHVRSKFRSGLIAYRVGPATASADKFRIVVNGRQTHGSSPWLGVDPIVVASQIVLGLQTIPSRQVSVIRDPAIVSVGSIHGGIRNNIIPGRVEMVGTVRTFDEAIRVDIHRRIERTAMSIAESAGATADVEIEQQAPVTINDPALTARVLPTLRRVAGPDNVMHTDATTGYEDFAYFARRVPGFYVWLGVTRDGLDPLEAPTNHSPLFEVDEPALSVGVKLLVALVLDYAASGGD